MATYTNKNFRLNNESDVEVLEFLKNQPTMKQTETFKLGIEILIELFGNENITSIHKEIKKYGLLNVLDSSLDKARKKTF